VLKRIIAHARGLTRRRRIEIEADEEFQYHLDRETSAHVARGVDVVEARRLALRDFGGVAQTQEAVRDVRKIPLLDSFWLDVKLGGRMLRKTWGLTLVGGLALTSAISIALGLFNVYQGLTGASLPLDEGDRVVSLMVLNRAAQTTVGVPPREVQRWKESLRSVVSLGAFRTVERNLAVDNRQVALVSVAEITATGFDVARVPPLRGRSIRIEDERPGAEAVVVIGHDAWTSAFSSDSAVVGRTVRIDGVVHTVIGVMPKSFAFPVNHQYWTPLKRDLQESLESLEPLIVFGRLAPGAELATADAELRTIGLLTTTSREDDGRRARVMSYVAGVSGAGGGGAAYLSFLFTTAGLLLFPPCANIAILFYARIVGRQREFAARHALGGSRARILGQLYLEALVLVAVATLASLAIVSRVGEHLQSNLRLRHGNPFWLDLGAIAPETLLFAVVIAGLAAGIVGLLPALQAVGRLTDVTTLSGRSSVTLGAMWTSLVAAQVALSIAVIPVAGEVAWGIVRPTVLGPGFAAEQFLTARVSLGLAPGPNVAEPADTERFERLQTEAARRLEELPEVALLARSAMVPGTESQVQIDIRESRGPKNADDAGGSRQTVVRLNAVDASFFKMFDMSVVAGRIFDDSRGHTGQVLVNRTLARHLATDGNPVGWWIRDRSAGDASGGSGSWQEIVGVVDDLHASDGRGTVYVSLPENQHPVSLSMRLTSGSAQVAQRLGDLVKGIDAGLHFSEVRSLADVYRDNARGVYLAGLMLGSGALSVLLLAAAGVYALMAFTVARQRRQIGIRSALGARSTRLLAGILGRAASQIGIGAAAGVLLALWLGAYLPVERLGGVHVPGLIPAAALLMTVVGLLAAAGPALRALRLEPTEVLRDN
jgi:predicted permease